MDTVINKISEIESAAASIMDDANIRKKAFSKELEERTASFDVQLEADTTRRINDLRAKMEIEMDTKLSKQKSDAEKILELMESHFDTNHEEYAKELFQKMTKE